MPLPVLDPGGWKLLPPVETVGALIPEATVTAQLSIANPVRLGYSHLLTSANFVFSSLDSCHLLWAHRYHYSVAGRRLTPSFDFSKCSVRVCIYAYFQRSSSR